MKLLQGSLRGKERFDFARPVFFALVDRRYLVATKEQEKSRYWQDSTHRDRLRWREVGLLRMTGMGQLPTFSLAQKQPFRRPVSPQSRHSYNQLLSSCITTNRRATVCPNLALEYAQSVTDDCLLLTHCGRKDMTSKSRGAYIHNGVESGPRQYGKDHDG